MVERAPDRPGAVLLTYARGLMTGHIAHSLAERGVAVFGADSLDMTVLDFSRHCERVFRVPDAKDDPDGFLEGLVAALRDIREDTDGPLVLMPVFDETPLIAANAARFDRLCRVAAPPIEAIRRVDPKDALVALAAAHDLSAPVSRVVRSPDDVDAAVAAVGAPAVSKPPVGVGGRGVVFHDDAGDLRARLEAAAKRGEVLIAQAAAPGEDICVALLCEAGEVLAIHAYRNLGAFPRDGGAGVLRETIDAAPFAGEAARLARAAGWSGVCELDYRHDSAAGAPPLLIEVNARFWASVNHSILSGVDFPWLLFAQVAHGVRPGPVEAEIGKTSRIPVLWWLSAIEDATHDDAYFERVGRAWERVTRDDINRFTAVWKALRQTFDLDEASGALDRVRAALETGEAAADDFLPEDDPTTALGGLFALSSLLRHGKLPPELTYD